MGLKKQFLVRHLIAHVTQESRMRDAIIFYTDGNEKVDDPTNNSIYGQSKQSRMVSKWHSRWKTTRKNKKRNQVRVPFSWKWRWAQRQSKNLKIECRIRTIFRGRASEVAACCSSARRRISVCEHVVKWADMWGYTHNSTPLKDYTSPLDDTTNATHARTSWRSAAESSWIQQHTCGSLARRRPQVAHHHANMARRKHEVIGITER